MQHIQRGHGGADIDHCNGLVESVVGHLLFHQGEGVLHDVGLDIDNLGGQAGYFQRGNTIIDILAA